MPLPDTAADDLSLANFYDGSEPLGEYPEDYDIYEPPVTLDHIREHAPDLISQFVDDGGRETELTTGSEDFDAEAFAEIVAGFSDTAGYEDWRRRYEPAMTYCWPVHIYRNDKDERTATSEVTALMDAYAPSCTLVKLTESDEHVYHIALSGGGQDLSEEIVAAYLCAGVVPPLTLLQRQRQSMDDRTFRRLMPLYGAAIERARGKLQLDCDRLAEDFRHMASTSKSAL